MSRLVGFLAMGLLAGCSDYELVGGHDYAGEANPPDLSTPVQNDRIVQVTVPSVDVLWVIDNSCSMYEEQTALTSNFANFMSYFEGSGLDYHVGVISTDMDDPDHRGILQQSATGDYFIDETTSDATLAFRQMALMGTEGSADEKGRDAVYMALGQRSESGWQNEDFIRDDANLSIIVISDENDYSTAVSLPEFISWLEDFKPDLEMTSFSSIVGPRPNGCDTAYEAGTDYLAVTDAVGGIDWSICNSNWDEVLVELGMQAAGLKNEFFLSEVPIEETIVVTVVDGDDVWEFDSGTDYLYSRSRNSVTFVSYVPEPLAEVNIEYELLSAWQPVESDSGLSADTGE